MWEPVIATPLQQGTPRLAVLYFDGGLPLLAGRKLNVDPRWVSMVYLLLVNLCLQRSRGVRPAPDETTSCVDVFRDNNLSQRTDVEGGRLRDSNSVWGRDWRVGKSNLQRGSAQLCYQGCRILHEFHLESFVEDEGDRQVSLRTRGR